ncbi:hypothetical protein, partial [Legionella sp. 28fT52]|uniref:hypothetical protein n=1 Tax=Legionella sp. 28fT52 TaxID=3410134 RepID=UPI003AF8E90C
MLHEIYDPGLVSKMLRHASRSSLRILSSLSIQTLPGVVCLLANRCITFESNEGVLLFQSGFVFAVFNVDCCNLRAQDRFVGHCVSFSPRRGALKCVQNAAPRFAFFASHFVEPLGSNT